jgi:hypothetical protein
VKGGYLVWCCRAARRIYCVAVRVVQGWRRWLWAPHCGVPWWCGKVNMQVSKSEAVRKKENGRVRKW